MTISTIHLYLHFLKVQIAVLALFVDSYFFLFLFSFLKKHDKHFSL